MKNRAKCKLCQSIIESFHVHDYVKCACGEIAVDGGTDYYKVMANDFSNFLRIDDEGNEIEVTLKEKESYEEDVKPIDIDSKPNRASLIGMLDEMANNIDRLPSYAKQSPVNQYDLQALISLLSLILKT